MEVIYQNPLMLWFLLLIPLLVAVHFYSLKHAKQKAMRFANIEALGKIVAGGELFPNNYGLLAMRIATLVLFTFAASGITAQYKTSALAYNYVITIDTSNSMMATDLLPTRMEASRVALTDWLKKIPADSKIGLVEFSGQATSVAPLGTRHDELENELAGIYPGKSGGTAICEAIKASSNMFIGTADNAPKAIILVSDGQNNAGCLLDDGISYARANNVTVFSVGVGSSEGGRVEDITGVVFTLDDTDLRRVAMETGGEYYRAQTSDELESIFNNMDNAAPMQKTLDLSVYAMLAAFLLVFIDWGLSITRYRAIP